MNSFKGIYADIIRMYTVSNELQKRWHLLGVNLHSLFLLKQSEANISSVMNVKSFLPVIVVVSSPNQYN